MKVIPWKAFLKDNISNSYRTKCPIVHAYSWSSRYEYNLNYVVFIAALKGYTISVIGYIAAVCAVITVIEVTAWFPKSLNLDATLQNTMYMSTKLCKSLILTVYFNGKTNITGPVLSLVLWSKLTCGWLSSTLF